MADFILRPFCSVFLCIFKACCYVERDENKVKVESTRGTKKPTCFDG